jgi:hypothetical protein
MVRGVKFLSVASYSPKPARSNASAVLQFHKRWRDIPRIFQAVAWALAGTIVVLSPSIHAPTTGVAHGLEHLAIFLATGMAFRF